jgi:imidazoleglycerol phosphate dehydratase HisB
MRTAKVNRKTKETDISCEINIDGQVKMKFPQG